MSFASLIFFCFLPTVFFLHWLVPKKSWQNSVLLAASYVFYGWWDWRFCSLMLASSLIDYFAGLGLESEKNARRRKVILAAAMTANLTLLGFFKYFNFFVDSLAIALASVGVNFPASPWAIVLPVGISFYTFQTMSYSIDIYRGTLHPKKNLIDYLTFVSFFPQLVAGPIERAANLLPQFYAARSFHLAEAREGCRFMLWGLAKKMVLADNLGRIADSAYNSSRLANGGELFIGTICFALQIYCDFSGYSEIAAGAAKLFGIQLTRNFAYPYFSQSITEFWRRWHITLSTWFRDYVYIPLGGRRVNRSRQLANLFATAWLSGIWHGAAWHFAVWGGLHGAFLAGERFLSPGSKRLRNTDTPGGEGLLPNPAAAWRIARTFAIVCLGWVFFRAADVDQAFQICGKLGRALFEPNSYRAAGELAAANGLTLFFAGVLLATEWFKRRHWCPFSIGARPMVWRWTAYTALFWVILYYGTGHTEPFIYFRF